MGKTLVVYYAISEKARASFEASRRAGEVDVMELRERFDRTPLEAATLGACQALSGTASRIDPIEVDLSAYDAILLATPVWCGRPAPAVNAFLYQTDLTGREVTAILVSQTRAATPDCARIMRRRIQSAGGVCRDVLHIRLKDLVTEESSAYEIAASRVQLA